MPAGYLGLPLNIAVALAAVACLALAACDSGVPAPPVVYVPPSMPTFPAANAGIKEAIGYAKLLPPIEISDFRPTDFGPGRFVACIRGVSNDYRTGTYAVFFNNNQLLGLRLPVGSDCEHQNYRPFVPDVPPAKPVPKKPAKKART
jgi:hypothetical protein